MMIFTYKSLLKYIVDNNIDVRDRLRLYPDIYNYVFYFNSIEMVKRLNDPNLNNNLVEINLITKLPDEIIFNPSVHYIMTKELIKSKKKELYISYNDLFSFRSLDGKIWIKHFVDTKFRPGNKYNVIDYYKNDKSQIVYACKSVITNFYEKNIKAKLDEKISSMTVHDVLLMNNVDLIYDSSYRKFKDFLWVNNPNKIKKNINEYNKLYANHLETYNEICKFNNNAKLYYRYINNVLYKLDLENKTYKTYIFKKEFDNNYFSIDDFELFMKSSNKIDFSNGELVK